MLMKLAELIYNKKKKESGQSLLELIVAVGIFIVSASSLAFFVFNSYSSGSYAHNFLEADLLAQEGMEATLSIRNNNWENLIPGTYRLILTDDGWSLEPAKNYVDLGLKEAVRLVHVEDVSQDRKKVTVSVHWAGDKNTSVVSYLTNWQKTALSEIRRPSRHQDFPPRQTVNPAFAYDNSESFSETNFGSSKDPSIVFFGWEAPSFSYSALSLNIRYSVQAPLSRSADDEYAIAFSENGCGVLGPIRGLISDLLDRSNAKEEVKEVKFIDIVPLSSEAKNNAVVSVELSPGQDLSLLCLKVYTQLNGSPDRRLLYINDIWTEGSSN